MMIDEIIPLRAAEDKTICREHAHKNEWQKWKSLASCLKWIRMTRYTYFHPNYVECRPEQSLHFVFCTQFKQ